MADLALLSHGEPNWEIKVNNAIKLLNQDQLKRIGQTPEQMQNEFYIDNAYWAENLNTVLERFDAWILSK